ncbi:MULTISPECIES: FkbM family methyltransferase [Streptomyces]|uniref:Methyltransferase, FkbM family n=1 Tax=Streptomyces pini TaxID=1520580 RepID=A0A1I4H3F0_9ACTN|nr:FkbM family methyltransferase [Streptomyces pini]SFL35911.1 methyltransferase, FkbM family [Streptomyces pini]
MSIALADVEGVNQHETEFLYDEIFTRRGYLPKTLHLPEDPVVFDVGANIGVYTLFVKSERPGAAVYSFEPVPEVYEVMCRNRERHGVAGLACPYGLAEKEQEVEFTHYPGYSTMSTRSTLADTEAEKTFVRGQVPTGHLPEAEQMLDELLAYRFRERTVRCRLRPLSAFLDEHPVERIDMLKIDVQRGELEVLRGIGERHWPLVRQLAVEVHDSPGGATAGRLRAVTEGLERRGFRVEAVQEEQYAGSDRHFVFAVSERHGARGTAGKS